jgi:hypothetical protein
MKYSMSVLRRTISIHEQLLLETNNMETHRIGWFRTVRKDLEGGGLEKKLITPFQRVQDTQWIRTNLNPVGLQRAEDEGRMKTPPSVMFPYLTP